MVQVQEGAGHAQSTKLAGRGHPESEAVLVMLAEDGAYRPVYVGPVGGVECLREGWVHEAVALFLVPGLPVFALAVLRAAWGRLLRNLSMVFVHEADSLID